MHDWVVWCKSEKGAEEIRSFELSGKEIFLNYDEKKSKENGEFSSNTRSLNENELPKKCRFSKNSVLNPQTVHELSQTALSVTNSLVYGAVARQSTHELSHVVDEWCIA